MFWSNRSHVELAQIKSEVARAAIRLSYMASLFGVIYSMSDSESSPVSTGVGLALIGAATGLCQSAWERCTPEYFRTGYYPALYDKRYMARVYVKTLAGGMVLHAAGSLVLRVGSAVTSAEPSGLFDVVDGLLDTAKDLVVGGGGYFLCKTYAAGDQAIRNSGGVVQASEEEGDEQYDVNPPPRYGIG